jgi:hypothetical protein
MCYTRWAGQERRKGATWGCMKRGLGTAIRSCCAYFLMLLREEDEKEKKEKRK